MCGSALATVIALLPMKQIYRRSSIDVGVKYAKQKQKTKQYTNQNKTKQNKKLMFV